MAVVAAHAFQPVQFARQFYPQSQLLVQRVRLGQRHGDDGVVRVFSLVHEDVVLVLAPALLILGDVALRHVDAEVRFYSPEGVTFQIEDAVAAHADAVQCQTVVEGVLADVLQRGGQRDGLHFRTAVEGVGLNPLQAVELLELAEFGQLCSIKDALLEGLQATYFRREEDAALIGQGERDEVVVEHGADAQCAAAQLVVAHVLGKLALRRIRILDGSLPRVAVVAGDVLVGQEHQLLDAAVVVEVLQDVAFHLRSLTADGDALQARSHLEDVLADVGHRLREDDGLDRRTVVEQVVAHLVVGIGVFVLAIAVVRPAGVLLQLCVPQVQVAQLAVRLVAVPRVGAGHVADDGQVVAVQRADDRQRVVHGVGTLQPAHLRVIAWCIILHDVQTQLAGQLSDAGHGDHLAVRVLAHAYDVVLVFRPLLLVERHHRVGHVDLQSAVLLEVVASDKRGGLARRHHDGRQVRAACEGARLNLGQRRGQGDGPQPFT